MTSFRILAICVSLTLAATSVATSLTATARANASPPMPDGHHMAMLLHSAVAALDQANRSGNYTVLRALAAPSFQRANDPARLARIFARFRQSRINLAPAILHDPMLYRQAHIDQTGRLKLNGYFPTRPMRINFDMQFEYVSGQWRLFGLSIQPRLLQHASN